MSYKVKEIFLSLQGEGFHTGRVAVFCRFSGCNLWTGREEDRAKAICTFCDTDFVGTDGINGGTFKNAEELAQKILTIWQETKTPTPTKPFVVCTGGEPLLQLDTALIDALHQFNFEIAVETNGTQLPPDGIDWICVSPKAKAPLKLTHGNELKLVHPQPQIDPEQFLELDFQYFYLQPLDDSNQQKNVQKTIHYCLTHPQWRLSLQTHKYLGIP